MVFGKKSYQSSTRSGAGADLRTATCHTRVSGYTGAGRAAGDAALSAYAERSRLEPLGQRRGSDRVPKNG